MVAQTPAISQDDRALAALAHGSAFVGFPFIAPICIYFYKRDQSRFVAFHALQALITHLGFFAVAIGGYILSIITSVVSVALLEKGPSVLEPLLFMLGWFVFLGVPSLTIAGIEAYATYRAWIGHGYRIPIAGRIALRILDAPAPAAPPPI
jgi:uncharacterized membrane protein